MGLWLRETSYLDPVWAFRPEHVHWVLSLVIDYWGDETGAEPFHLGGPLASKCVDRAEVLEEARERWLESLAPVPMPPRLGSDVDIGHAGGEGAGVVMLYASVLWEAVRDWADNCYSPFAVEQRRALQAYWWFMGLPYTTPRGLSEEDWAMIARGRKRKFKVPTEETNPLPSVGLTIPSLFCYRVTDPELPPQFRDSTPITFLACCSALGIDPTPVRKYLHTVRPD